MTDFFLSSAGTALLTVSNDLGVLHKAHVPTQIDVLVRLFTFFTEISDPIILQLTFRVTFSFCSYEKSWSVGTLENFLRATSRQARGALETAAANLTDTEKEAVSSYLAYNTAVAKLHRVPTPQTVVATATLLDSLAG